MKIVSWGMAVMFAAQGLIFGDGESLIFGLLFALVGISLERRIT